MLFVCIQSFTCMVEEFSDQDDGVSLVVYPKLKEVYIYSNVSSDFITVIRNI